MKLLTDDMIVETCSNSLLRCLIVSLVLGVCFFGSMFLIRFLLLKKGSDFPKSNWRKTIVPGIALMCIPWCAVLFHGDTSVDSPQDYYVQLVEVVEMYSSRPGSKKSSHYLCYDNQMSSRVSRNVYRDTKIGDTCYLVIRSDGSKQILNRYDASKYTYVGERERT